MNNKVANLIAIELGVLIAIMAWLAFSNLRSIKSLPVTKEPERAIGAFATVAPVLKSRNQRRSAMDYRAELAAQLQQEEEQAQTSQEYDQAIATEPYTNSSLDGDLFTEASPSYAELGQERYFDSPDCLVSPVDQYVIYPQSSAIIVFSNSRSRGRRPRSTVGVGGTRMMAAHRRPNRQQPHALGGRAVPRQVAHLQSSRERPKIRTRQID